MGNKCSQPSADEVRRDIAEHRYWRDALCNWRDVGAVGGLLPNMFYRSSEVYPEPYLAQIKTIIDLRRPKDHQIEDSRRATMQDLGVEIRESGELNPEHVTKRKINFVPTNPTGLAIFRAIPTSSALSSVAPWNDTELHMQMSIRDHLGFDGLYCLILEHSKPQILEALQVFANPESYPILVHCIHGKDRTGLLCGLVSLICGVPEETVVRDFHESEEELLGAKALGVPRIVKYEDWQLLAPAEAMSKTITYLKELTGKTDANAAARKFATIVGLTHEERDSIQNILKWRKMQDKPAGADAEEELEDIEEQAEPTVTELLRIAKNDNVTELNDDSARPTLYTPEILRVSTGAHNQNGFGVVTPGTPSSPTRQTQSHVTL